MAESNPFGLSVLTQLSNGKGWYAYSGEVTASTNNKPVIQVNNTGQKDSIVTITFGGSLSAVDLGLGSTSHIRVLLGGEVIYKNKLNTVDGMNPFNCEFSLFIPRNSTFVIQVVDADTTGSSTTMVRGYYL